MNSEDFKKLIELDYSKYTDQNKIDYLFKTFLSLCCPEKEKISFLNHSMYALHIINNNTILCNPYYSSSYFADYFADRKKNVKKEKNMHEKKLSNFFKNDNNYIIHLLIINSELFNDNLEIIKENNYYKWKTSDCSWNTTGNTFTVKRFYLKNINVNLNVTQDGAGYEWMEFTKAIIEFSEVDLKELHITNLP